MKIKDIARQIRMDWKNVSPYAEPYLRAMESLGSIDDTYGADDARTVVLYFLSNANGYKGQTARQIKANLKSLLNK